MRLDNPRRRIQCPSLNRHREVGVFVTLPLCIKYSRDWVRTHSVVGLFGRTRSRCLRHTPCGTRTCSREGSVRTRWHRPRTWWTCSTSSRCLESESETLLAVGRGRSSGLCVEINVFIPSKQTRFKKYMLFNKTNNTIDKLNHIFKVQDKTNQNYIHK